MCKERHGPRHSRYVIWSCSPSRLRSASFCALRHCPFDVILRCESLPIRGHGSALLHRTSEVTAVHYFTHGLKSPHSFLHSLSDFIAVSGFNPSLKSLHPLASFSDRIRCSLWLHSPTNFVAVSGITTHLTSPQCPASLRRSTALQFQSVRGEARQCTRFIFPPPSLTTGVLCYKVPLPPSASFFSTSSQVQLQSRPSNIDLKKHIDIRSPSRGLHLHYIFPSQPSTRHRL